LTGRDWKRINLKRSLTVLTNTMSGISVGIHESMVGSLADRVSTLIFGASSFFSARRRAAVSGVTTTAVLDDGSVVHRETDVRKSVNRLRDRGLMSYVVHEQTRVKAKCAAAETIILNVTFDDAGYLASPNAAEVVGSRDGGGVPADDDADAQYGGRRRKVLVVLNILQDVFTKGSDIGGRLTFFSLHSPGQLMRRANWSTLRDRLRKWLLFTPAGAGRNRDCTGTLQPVLDGVPRKFVVYTRDALPANNAVIAYEQNAFHPSNAEHRLAGRRNCTLSISIDCVHHQGSLANLHQHGRMCCPPFVIGSSPPPTISNQCYQQ